MRTVITLLIAFFLAAPIWAADGDPCSGGYIAPAGATCVMLCDGKTGTATCSPRSRVENVHERIWIEVADESGCSAYTVVVTTASKLTGGVEHEVGTLTYGGDTMLNLDGFGAHTLSHVEADITALTGCTNLDVLMHMR